MMSILKVADIVGLHGRIVLDVETCDGPQPHLGSLVGLGVWAEDAGVIGYVPCRDELDEIEIAQAVRTWRPGSWLIGHHLKYEAVWTRMSPDFFDRFRVWDTVVVEHLVSGMLEGLEKDLGSLETRYLKTYTKKRLLKEGDKHGGIKKIRQWPLELQADYCVNDCRITKEVAALQTPKLKSAGLTEFAQKQMQYLKKLYRMERRGIVLDRKRAFEMGQKIERLIGMGMSQLEALCSESGVSLPSKFSIRSPQAVSRLLYEDLALPRPECPPELVGTAQAGVYNSSTLTDKTLLMGLNHPVPAQILKMKGLSTIGSYLNSYTKLERPIFGNGEDPFFPELDDEDFWWEHPEEGRVPRFSTVHSSFNSAGTETGRLSSSGPNMQQVSGNAVGMEMDPDGLGVFLRNIFRARPGFKLGSFDYKQMEVVVFGALSQDPKMMELIQRGEDIYDLVAEVMYGHRGSPYRNWVKQLVLGLLYGLGKAALAKALGLSMQETTILEQKFFAMFPRVRPYMRELEQMLQTYGFVQYWSGRKAVIRDPQFFYRGVNRAVQGGSADLMAEAATRVDDLLLPYGGGLLSIIHDETVTEIPEDHVEELVPQLSETMKVPDLLGVPLRNDVKSLSTYWYEKDVEELKKSLRERRRNVA